MSWLRNLTPRQRRASSRQCWETARPHAASHGLSTLSIRDSVIGRAHAVVRGAREDVNQSVNTAPPPSPAGTASVLGATFRTRGSRLDGASRTTTRTAKMVLSLSNVRPAELWRGSLRALPSVLTLLALLALAVALASTYIGSSPSPYGACYAASGHEIPCRAAAHRR